jgi:hypothetical protein
LAIGQLPLPPLPAVGEFQFGIMAEVEGETLTLYVVVAQVDVTVFTVIINASDSRGEIALQGVRSFGRVPQTRMSTLSVSLLQATSSRQTPVCIVLAYSAAPACSVVVDERCSNETSLPMCVANTTSANVLSSSIAGLGSLSSTVYVLLYSMSPILETLPQRGDPAGSARAQAASVYGAVLSAPANDDETWVVGKEWRAGFRSRAGEPLYLYMGDNPSVALAPTKSAAIGGSDLLSVAFLLTHDSGYCPNSEKNNKRADQGVCDIAPTMCEGSSVLNYAYGSVHTLQQLLQQKEPLSPCHPSIVSLPRPPSTTRSSFIALHMSCAS